MAGFNSLLLLTVFNFLTISLTVFRLCSQARRLNVLWYDDALVAITACGGALTLGCLLSMIIHAPAPRPLEYHMVLVSYFFVLWVSRACLIMMTARVRVLREGPPGYLARVSFPTCVFIAIGVAYTVLATFFCNKEPDCPIGEPCFCTLKPKLVLCALITDIIADIGLLSYNWYFFAIVVKTFAAHVARRWLVYLGFSGSICTLIVNVVFWKSYMTSRPDDYVLFVCLSNAVTITSIITANMSFIVGVVCRALSIADAEDTPEVEPEDTPNTQHHNVIVLQPSRSTDPSVMTTSGHSEPTVGNGKADP